MRKADALVALGLVSVAGLVLWEGRRLGIGWGSDGPRPGFLVFYLGLALVASAVAILLQAARGDTPLYRRAFVRPGQARSVAKVVVPAALMILLTHVVGLYVAGALYLAVYMRWIGRHSWPLTAGLAAAIPTVTFLIFEVWFLVPMPKGPLEAYLGY